MSFKFEKLIIWQDSMNFGENIFQMTHGFPKDELYNRYHLTTELMVADILSLLK